MWTKEKLSQFMGVVKLQGLPRKVSFLLLSLCLHLLVNLSINQSSVDPSRHSFLCSFFFFFFLFRLLH